MIRRRARSRTLLRQVNVSMLKAWGNSSELFVLPRTARTRGRMISAALELLLAEQDVPRLLIGGTLPRALDFILHHGESALDRWARLDTIVPALQMREVLQILALPMMGSQPWIGRHIGDRVLAGQIWNLADALIDDAVDAVGFVGVTVDGILDLFGRVTPEMMRLAQHRPHARHLEHQPLEHVVTAARILWHKAPSRFFRQVYKDCA